MNRLNILIITIVALILVSCKKADEEPSRAFYTNFSIGKIVDQNKDYLLGSSTDSSGVLLPGSRILTGAEAGPPEPFIQRYEEINFQIDEANLAAFMLAVKTDIEEEIRESGAKVQGYEQSGGSDREYFSFDYIYDQVYGTIHVWAVRGPENSMNIIVLLTEN